MKKNLIWIILICPLIYCTSYAQFEKGTRFTGATISLNGSSKLIESEFKTEKYNTSNFQITPQLQIGKFYKENRMMGIGLSLATTFSKNGENKYRIMAPELAPFLRQYKKLGEKWYIFLQESLPIQYSFTKSHDQNSTSKYNTFLTGIRILPGVGVKVGSKLYLESDINLLGLNLYYSHSEAINTVFFNSAINTGINSQFTLRAGWYIH